MKPEQDPHVLPTLEVGERIFEMMPGMKLDSTFNACRRSWLPRRFHALDERCARNADRSQDELGAIHPASTCRAVARGRQPRHNAAELPMRILPFDHPRRVPWKNGRGSTLELATDAATVGGAWTWRLSLADVPEAGPFSEYPGIDRSIVLLEGAGLVLESPGSRCEVPRAGRGLAFPGDKPTVGIPCGPGVRDANVMMVRGRWRGDVHLLLAGTHELRGDTVVVHAYDGALTIDGVAMRRVSIDRGETLITDRPMTLRVQTLGRAIGAVFTG